MRPTEEFFQELLREGCAYRYQSDRFAELTGGGQPYPSPVQKVETPYGEMVEEGIQPVLNTVTLSEMQVAPLTRLAALWPAFLNVQYGLYQKARRGELEPQAVQMIRGLCTEEEWECGLVEPGYRIIHPFIRLDAVWTENGWKVFDINSTRPAGVGDLMAYEAVMKNQLAPDIRNFGVKQAFCGIVRQCAEEWFSEKRLPGELPVLNIAVDQQDGDFRNFENLGKRLACAGITCRLIDPQELPSSSVALVLRSRIKEGSSAFDLLKQGYPEKRCVLSPLYRRFLGNKLWMYLFRIPPFSSAFKEELGEEGYRMFDVTMAEIGLVQSDRVLFPQGVAFFDQLSKDEWVIKDPSSSSGRRMYLGFAMGHKKWQEVVSQIRSGWIWQRFYPSIQKLMIVSETGEPKEKSLFTKYGVYIFGAVLGGLEFNARVTPVVHGSRNTYFNSVYLKTKAE